MLVNNKLILVIANVFYAANKTAKYFLLLAVFGGSCFAQSQEILDIELRETIVKVDATVSDLFARSETKPVVITIFRPPGEGKFPLLILNHGRAVEPKRHLQGRQRYLTQVRWFVEQGFVVMVPTRIGYGETFSSFDPEYTNSCRGGVRLETKDEALYRQIMATLEYAKTLSYVDASKWVIAGQSLGGYTAVTIARRAPDSLIGAINFAGGYGGDPDGRRGNSCSPHAWEDSLKKKISDRQVPTLWVYWKDDWYWGNEIPKRWFKAFQVGGGLGDFLQFSEIKGDGHSGFTRDLKTWFPAVRSFLQSLPIQLPSVSLTKATPAPPVSNFARINEVEKVPHIKEPGKEGYKNFLLKDSPRAFALNVDGKWGSSNGHWNSTDRALNFCNKNAKTPCRLYAVDDDIVWTPEY